MSKISELSDGGSLVSSDYLIAVRSGGNVKVRMDQINVDQVDLGDNEFIRLGNSQDLTMVHTSTQSIINQAGIGDLLIQKAGATKLTINASGIDVTGIVQATGGNFTGQVQFNGTAGVQLDNGAQSHTWVLDDNFTSRFNIGTSSAGATWKFGSNNNAYLAVSPSGIDVTGTVTADGLTVVAADTALAASIGSNGQRVYITPNGTEISYNASGNAAGSHMFQTGNIDRLNIASNGDLSLYEDTGTTPKFYWDASVEALTLSGSGAGSLTLDRGASGNQIKFANAGTTLGYIGYAATTGFAISGADGGADVTVDASGNVGIGVVPENSSGTWRNLQFGGSNLAFRASGANDAMVGTGYLFKSDNSEVYKNTEAASRLFFDNSTTIFQQAASGTAGTAISWSEAMRIDGPTGTLLVGTTDSTPYNNSGAGNGGAGIQADGLISAARQDFPPAIFNRLVSDGDIVEFRKDGTTIAGSIGTRAGFLTIGEGAVGLLFQDSNSRIEPTNMTTLAATNGAVDIGGLNQRFKDLYLAGDIGHKDASGTARLLYDKSVNLLGNAGTNVEAYNVTLNNGIIFGDAGGSGTSSSNTLDSYEEGAWTPTGVGVTLASPSGTYTKVGRLVTVTWQFVYAITASGASASISGLPFTVGTNYNNGGNQGYVNGSAAVSIAHITAATTSLYYRTANGGTSLTHADFSGATIRGSMTYMTS